MVAYEYINRQGLGLQALRNVRTREMNLDVTCTNQGWVLLLEGEGAQAGFWKMLNHSRPLTQLFHFHHLPISCLLNLHASCSLSLSLAGFTSSLNHSFIKTEIQKLAYSCLFFIAFSDFQSLKCILFVYLSFLYPWTLQIERRKYFIQEKNYEKRRVNGLMEKPVILYFNNRSFKVLTARTIKIINRSLVRTLKQLIKISLLIIALIALKTVSECFSPSGIKGGANDCWAALVLWYQGKFRVHGVLSKVWG